MKIVSESARTRRRRAIEFVVSVFIGLVATLALRGMPTDIGLDIEPGDSGALRLVWSSGEVAMEEIASDFAPHRFTVEITAPEAAKGSQESGYQLIAMANIDRVEYAPDGAWARASNYFVLTGEERPAVLTLEGWNLGGAPYLAFEADPESGVVTVQSNEDSPVSLDLFSPKRARVIYPVGADKHLRRYFARVPRKALATLTLRNETGQALEIKRLYINAFLPRVFYADAAPRKHPVGFTREGWSGNWTAGTLSMPSGFYLGANSIATFFLCTALSLVGLIALRFTTRFVWRSIRQGLADPPEDLWQEPFRWKVLAAFWGPAFSVWLVFLLAFYPGTMNLDSLSQWRQAHEFVFYPHHPPFYSLIMWAAANVWDSPFSVAALQLVACSGLVALGFTMLWQAKAPRAVVLAMYALTVVSPRNNAMLIALIKDTPYAIAMLSIAVCLSWILLRRRRSNWGAWAALGFSMGLAMLFRHNGPPMVAAMLPIILLLALRHWRGWGLCTAVMLAVFLGFRLLVTPQIPLEKDTGVMHWYDMMTGHLAILVDRDVPMSNADYAFLANVRTLDDRWAYDPGRVDATTQPLLDEGLYERAWLAEHVPDCRRVYASLVTRNPLVAAQYFWERGAYLYVPWATDTPLETYFLGITPNDQGLSSYSLMLTVPGALESALAWTDRGMQRWLFWYPALPMYLVLVAGAVLCWRRRDAAWSLPFLPFFANTGILTLAAVLQSTRYQFPLTLAAGFLLALSCIPRPRALDPPRQSPL